MLGTRVVDWLIHRAETGNGQKAELDTSFSVWTSCFNVCHVPYNEGEYTYGMRMRYVLTVNHSTKKAFVPFVRHQYSIADFAILCRFLADRPSGTTSPEAGLICDYFSATEVIPRYPQFILAAEAPVNPYQNSSLSQCDESTVTTDLPLFYILPRPYRPSPWRKKGSVPGKPWPRNKGLVREKR